MHCFIEERFSSLISKCVGWLFSGMGSKNNSAPLLCLNSFVWWHTNAKFTSSSCPAGPLCWAGDITVEELPGQRQKEGIKYICHDVAAVGEAGDGDHLEDC